MYMWLIIGFLLGMTVGPMLLGMVQSTIYKLVPSSGG